MLVSFADDIIIKKIRLNMFIIFAGNYIRFRLQEYAKK